MEETMHMESPFMAYRRKLGISRDQLARAMGVAAGTLKGLEKGWARTINIRVLRFLELAGENTAEYQRKYEEYYAANTWRQREQVMAMLADMRQHADIV